MLNFSLGEMRKKGDRVQTKSYILRIGTEANIGRAGYYKVITLYTATQIWQNGAKACEQRDVGGQCVIQHLKQGSNLLIELSDNFEVEMLRTALLKRSFSQNYQELHLVGSLSGIVYREIAIYFLVRVAFINDYVSH